jgi:hypothetical protein
VHLNRLGKTDRLAHQALDPDPQRQVFAFNLLRAALARLVLIRIEMTRVSAPLVRVIASALLARDSLGCERHLAHHEFMKIHFRARVSYIYTYKVS